MLKSVNNHVFGPGLEMPALDVICELVSIMNRPSSSIGRNPIYIIINSWKTQFLYFGKDLATFEIHGNGISDLPLNEIWCKIAV